MMVSFKKIKILLIIAGWACFNSTFAQFSGGAHFGLNTSNLRGSSAQNKSMLIGYNIGGFANFSGEELLQGDIADILSFQVDLNIETKGAVMDYPAVENPADTFFITKSQKLNLTYVSIPVMAKFSFGDPKGLLYYGEAGFYGAGLFGVSVDGEKEYDHDFDSQTPNRNYRDDFDGFDVGLIIGGGASLPFGGRKSPWRAFSEIRYTYGLASVGEFRENTPDYFEKFVNDLKTSAISLSFGFSYKFPSSK